MSLAVSITFGSELRKTILDLNLRCVLSVYSGLICGTITGIDISCTSWLDVLQADTCYCFPCTSCGVNVLVYCADRIHFLTHFHLLNPDFYLAQPDFVMYMYPLQSELCAIREGNQAK